MRWFQRSMYVLTFLSAPVFAMESDVNEVLSQPQTAEQSDRQESDGIFEGVKVSEPKAPQPIAERALLADGMVEQRVQGETASASDPFVLTSHRPNYFLPLSYTHNPNKRETRQGIADDSLQSIEFQFQVSIKFPVATGVVGDGSSLWFAYTQQSYWQAYNSDASAPFRDTNYEPEAFIVTNPDLSFFGNKLTYLHYGVNHQSNGQQKPLSRSWNRVYLDFIFERDNTVVSIKPWYRIPEPSDDNDNPDIDRYMGYGELNVIHVIDDVSYEVMLRNNLRSENKGAIRLGVNFPLWGKVRGYGQYFEGYGQSMLDYNNYTRTVGVGFMLTGWL
ncbi:phospholipase A [Marinomonas piezotolerans]|nr:phospholipase A [Marinomonas piezotolerans]